MRKEKAAGRGIIDRAGSDGRGTIRARLSRADAYGRQHDEKASWHYHDAATRRHAIDTAEDWLRTTKRRIRDTPELRAEAERRGVGKTLRQWVVDYADDLGYTLAEVEVVDEKTGGVRVVLSNSKVRRTVNRAGLPVIDKTDAGARSEVMALRGWLKGFTPDSPPLADLVVDKITAADLDAAIDAMTGVSPDTIRRRLAVLKAVARHARDVWKEKALIAALDAAEWPAKADLRPGRYVQHAEWQAIMGVGGRVEPLTLAAIRYLRWTGCRRGEAGRLAWDDIAEEESQTGPVWRIHVRNQKNPIKTPVAKLRSVVGRKIPIDDAAWDALLLAAQAQHALTGTGVAPKSVRALKTVLRGDQDVRPADRQMQGRVFAGLKGESISNAWRKLCARAGVEARLHDLRHTRTTEYVQELGSILEAAAMSGHSDTQMLQIYHHADVGMIAKKQQAARTKISATAQKRIAASRKAEADAAKRRDIGGWVRRTKRAAT